MAFKSKRVRANYRKKRMAKRRSPKAYMRPRATRDQATTMNKTVFYEDALTSGLLTASNGVLNFRLSQISDHITLTNVYDQYRINWVKVQIIPKTNVAGIAENKGVNTIPVTVPIPLPLVGLVGSAVDYDTNTAPASMAALCEYNNFKYTRGLDVHTRVLKPRPQTIWQSGGTTVQSPVFTRENPWIDCVKPDVDHLGLRFIIEDSDTALVTYDIMVKYNLSFKNVH